MQTKNNPAQELKDYLALLLPPEKKYMPFVSEEEQAKKLELLDAAIPDESFYVVYNLQTGEFEHANGVDKWLGYPDNEFTVNRYLACIDPKQVILHNMIARSMYKLLCSGMFRLQFSRQRYISRIGLRHNDGSYIEFKKTTSIFQYDNENRLLAQLNEFTKIGTYEGASLDTRVTEIDGVPQKDIFERMVFQETIKAFMEKKYFSPRELEILRMYAEEQEISTKQLAETLKLVAATVNELNKRILGKARNTFTHQFDTAREVALYLKKEKIL
jgi:DNA-binding CsgD family transcriptional regulator